MITAITQIVRLGRQARAISVPLVVVGVLAAGCGTATYNGTPASGASSAPGSAATNGAGSATGTGSAAPAPVPTVSGGPVVAGEPECAGWPVGTPSATLPLSFVPVSVERCVTGSQAVPGKGQWVTATLQRSDTGLTPLVNALRRPAGSRSPGTVCPAFAVLPPQIVLTDATGQRLIPRVPVSGCGQVQSQVFVALASLHWTVVSVRLIEKIPAASSGSSAQATITVSPAPTHPKSGGIQPQ